MNQKTQIKTCYGISSLCVSNPESIVLNTLCDKHVIFYDYDCKKNAMNKSKVISLLRMLQIKFDVGNFYVLESTHGYNAFCIDKIKFSRLKTVLSCINLIDKDFVKYGLKRGYFTLRLSDDKKYIGMVENPSVYEKSLIHKIVFSNLWDIDISLNNCDKNRFCDIIRFPSDKNGYHTLKTERVEI